MSDQPHQADTIPENAGLPIRQDLKTSLYRHLIKTYQDGAATLYTLVQTEYPQPIAAAIVKHTGYLLWLEVVPSHRRQGIATGLLRELSQFHPVLIVSAGSEDGDAWVPATRRNLNAANLTFEFE